MDTRDPRAFLGRGWSLPVRAADSPTDVASAAYDEDIREAILIVLETEPGERVMRPDFGAGLRRFVFEPVNTATLAMIRHRVETALIEWEPRIDLVEVRTAGRGGRIDVEIDYRVRSTNTFYNLVYPFYLQEGSPR